MAKIKPLISIIIPAAPGRKKDLWRCLRSVFKSDYRNWEVVIIDNSGESGYQQKIKKAFPDARIKIIKMPLNIGILGFNIGLANAKGDYLFLLDDDAAIKPDTLAKIIYKFGKLPKDIGVISCAVFDKTANKYQLDLSKVNLNKTFRSFCGASIFKKDVFSKIGFFEHRFFCWNYEEDYSFRLIERGYKIYFASRNEILIDHYSKQNKFRGKQVFLQTRNKFWLNVKYFSWHFLPLIIFRDLIFILLQPLRRRTWQAFPYALVGYLSGILTSFPFLRERRILSLSLQKKYLRAHIWEDFTSFLSNIPLLKSPSKYSQ